MNHPHQIYQATSVYTASRERLLLMIFEGAIRFCKESIQAVATKDFQLANDVPVLDDALHLRKQR